jgi:hypothetical protein
MLFVLEKEYYIEILISVKELKLIYKVFAFTEIGLKVSEFQEFLNVDEEYLEKLIQEFSCLVKRVFKKNIELKCCMDIISITENIIHLKLGEKEIRAIYGVLTNISIWISEKDISSIMGINIDEFKEVRNEIILLLRSINKYTEV